MKLLNIGIMLLALFMGNIALAANAKEKITPAVCTMIETEAGTVAQMILDGDDDEFIDVIMNGTMQEAASQVTDLTALWMVYNAVPFIRRTIDDKVFLTFAKRHPELTQAEALGLRMKIICSRSEGQMYTMPSLPVKPK